MGWTKGKPHGEETEEHKRNKSKATYKLPTASKAPKKHGVMTLEQKREAQKKGEAHQQFNKVIQNEMLSAIRDGLNELDENGVPYYQKYVSTFLQNAIDDPEGVCSRMLSSGLFNEKLLSKLDKEANEAIEKERDFVVYRLRQTLFDKQKEVFDNEIDRQILVICSRRSGKTELNARRLIKECFKKDARCLYLNKTFDNAIEQMFELVIKTAERIGIKVADNTSAREGFIHFGNGSSIKFGGVNNIEAIEKYRGFSFNLIIIDEVGHLGKHTNYLIDQVLTPATADYADSQMIFTGTPPRTKNYAVKLWNSRIKKYNWTLFDNPYIPNAEGFVKQVCDSKGITIDDPFVQREYMGVVGAFDSEAQVFRNALFYDELPKDFHLSKIYIGVDFGFQDFNGIVSIFIDNLNKKAYVYRCRKFNRAGFEEVAGSLIAAYEDAQSEFVKRGLNDKNNIKIITDTNEPMLAYDLSTKYKLPIEKAYKYDLKSSIEQTAEALRTRVYTHSSLNDLKDEYESTVWKRDDDDNLISEIDDDVYHPDAAHALRYALRNVLEEWSHGVKPADNDDKPTVSKPVENAIRYTASLPPQFNNSKKAEYLGGLSL